MAKHARALKPGWFVSHSPKQTIQNIIEASDLAFLKRQPPEKFEQMLIDELEFLAPFSDEQMQEAKEYIHRNRDELYRRMKDLPIS
jgi:hypothetical protein